MKYYIGIDLGGTFIKGGIVNELGEILIIEQTPTQVELGNFAIVKNIATLSKSLAKKLNIDIKDCCGLGIGIPGMIDTEKGVVIFSGNLKFENFEMKKYLEQELSIPVICANDANVAALGESKFGAGSKYNDCVLVTLGTGVGGGIIINGKIFAGNKSAGAEIGHMIISVNGNDCTCGLKGCFEAYASATALIKLTKQEMEKNPSSSLWEVGIDNVNGQTPFIYMDKDKTAKKVVDTYLDYLSIGLTNIANVFRPEVILIGGGISNQGQSLVDALQFRLDKMIFAGNYGPKVEIKTASLKNKAGVLGASALLM